MIVEKQAYSKEVAGSYNVGPDEESCVTTGELVSLFCKYWGNEALWRVQTEKMLHMKLIFFALIVLN